MGWPRVLIQLAIEGIVQLPIHLGFELGFRLLPFLILLVHHVSLFNHAILDIAQLFKGGTHLGGEVKLHFFLETESQVSDAALRLLFAFFEI